MTRTEFSFTFFVASLDAIIPTKLIVAITPVMRKKSIMPTTVANTCFIKLFIFMCDIPIIIYKYSAKIVEIA